MSTLIAFALPGNDAFAKQLARLAHCEMGSLEAHQFPDGETHLKIGTDVNGRHLALVCTLANPNERILPLLLAADALRDSGATRIGVVAPYLAYMRQDRRFETGEVVTS